MIDRARRFGCCVLWGSFVFACAVPVVRADTVAELAARVRDQVVIVKPENREGQTGGLGAGFVISADGLIATALHVIGEARPIWVQLPSGEKVPVTEVYASDRTLDLAIVRIDAQGLKPLVLAGAEQGLAAGDTTVAIGHPLGLEHSVVSGRVASVREYAGVRMWQVGMTIEPGNSGCPLLDEQGRVQGVVVMKSTGREPFGFAVDVSHLRTLLERPNPIAMSNWKTIGRLDRTLWDPLGGARWHQRSGRIHVEGPGEGFGGRSLLLRVDEPPQVPFEVAVSVKLDDESGAAGLVFHADGKDKHYGFYPSAGRIRLASFEGPTVYSWNVVQELETPHYRPEAWNEIKVRVEKDKIVGYVNGHEVVTVNEIRQPVGVVGLCKFRQTEAEFKRFRVGPELASDVPAAEELSQLASGMNALPPRDQLLNQDLLALSDRIEQRRLALEQKAQRLEAEAESLRQLGTDLHVIAVAEQLRQVVAVEEDAKIDLLRGALWIARLDNAELEVTAYEQMVDGMVAAVKAKLKQDAPASEILQQLDAYLFTQQGFHGSRTDYYNAANSHLDRVLDDREGLPITLSVLYMTMAQRLGANVVGVGLPGHFVVRHEPSEEDAQLIDVFERGKRLTVAEAKQRVRASTGRPATDTAFATAKHRDILYRMLVNLLGVAQRSDDPAAMLRYLEALVAVDSEDARMRGMRAVLRHRQGRGTAALADLDWILEHEPEGIDLHQVRQMRSLFSQ